MHLSSLTSWIFIIELKNVLLTKHSFQKFENYPGVKIKLFISGFRFKYIFGK